MNRQQLSPLIASIDTSTQMSDVCDVQKKSVHHITHNRSNKLKKYEFLKGMYFIYIRSLINSSREILINSKEPLE